MKQTHLLAGGLVGLAIGLTSAVPTTLAAAPKPGLTLVETTPNGYTLTVSVAGSGKSGHLSISCPAGHGLGTSAWFKVYHGRFTAARKRTFTFRGYFDQPGHVRGTGSVRGASCSGSISEGPLGTARMLSCPASSPEAPLAPGTQYPFAGIVPNAARGTQLRLEYTDPNSPTGQPAVVHLSTDSIGRFSDSHAFPTSGGAVYGASATPRYPDDPLATGMPCGMTVQG